MSFLQGLQQSKELNYPSISPLNNYTNILLIDKGVANYQQFVNSANSSTFPIVYSVSSLKTDLLSLLRTNFTTISRIGVVFTSSLDKSKTFFDLKPIFTKNETEPYSENVTFLIDVIKEFHTTNIDFLACNTLNYSNWVNYYDILSKNTGVIVGASNDKTGNIKYGGDWVLESTSQNIESIYFTQSIEYYTYLLDNAVLLQNFRVDYESNVYVLLTIDVNNFYSYDGFPDAVPPTLVI